MALQSHRCCNCYSIFASKLFWEREPLLNKVKSLDSFWSLSQSWHFQGVVVEDGSVGFEGN